MLKEVRYWLLIKPFYWLRSLFPVKHNPQIQVVLTRSNPARGYMTVEYGVIDEKGELVPRLRRIVAIKVPRNWDKWSNEKKGKWCLTRREAKFTVFKDSRGRYGISG